jgi:5-(carboxyamino)imidazole ribonucleotide synthase
MLLTEDRPTCGYGRLIMMGHRLGVVGAGQLGQMIHQAAISLGVRIRFLAERDDDPAAQVCPSYELGSPMSADRLARFAAACDVVTFEHEVVDLEALAVMERGGVVLRPSSAVLSSVADKIAMRHAVEAAELPVPPWCRAGDLDQLDEALARWPHAVLKLSRGGYDGRGVFMVRSAQEGHSVGAQLLDGTTVLLVEPLLGFSLEAAVVVARRPNGECVVYDPVRTMQIDGQCRQVVVPSGMPPDLVEQARAIAIQAAEALDVVGLLAVELFLVDGELVVNELAVRPHNTAHHTIEACVTSQFDNHVRAVLDLPLGATDLTCASAAMVNVIVRADGDDPADHLAAALALDPAAHIHLYGKFARPNRKVGHVTVCDDDEERAVARAWRVVAALHGDVPIERQEGAA